MERLVKFVVLGQEYSLYTDAPDEDVEEILQLVKAQLEADNKGANVLPSHKIAVLTSLNMAGKYVKLKRDFELYKESVDEDVDRLAKRIEKFLYVR